MWQQCAALPPLPAGAPRPASTLLQGQDDLRTLSMADAAAQGDFTIVLVTFVTPIAPGRSAVFLTLAMRGDTVPLPLRIEGWLPAWVNHLRSNTVQALLFPSRRSLRPRCCSPLAWPDHLRGRHAPAAVRCSAALSRLGRRGGVR